MFIGIPRRTQIQRHTHRQVHILDLVITRECDDLVRGVSASSVSLSAFKYPYRGFSSQPHHSYTNYQLIYLNTLLGEVKDPKLVLGSPEDIDQLMDPYRGV